MVETNEQRLRILEKKLTEMRADYRAAFWAIGIVSTVFLGGFGLAMWGYISSEVKKQVSHQVEGEVEKQIKSTGGQEAVNKVRQLLEQAEANVSNILVLTQDIGQLHSDLLPSEGHVRIWWSNTFRFGLNESYEIEHELDVLPAAVIVWSSISENGPWDQVETIFGSYGSTLRHYGVYVADVDKKRLRLQSGNASVTSTYGGDDPELRHWEKYHGEASYNIEKAWFRIALIGGPD